MMLCWWSHADTSSSRVMGAHTSPAAVSEKMATGPTISRALKRSQTSGMP